MTLWMQLISSVYLWRSSPLTCFQYKKHWLFFLHFYCMLLLFKFSAVKKKPKNKKKKKQTVNLNLNFNGQHTKWHKNRPEKKKTGDLYNYMQLERCSLSSSHTTAHDIQKNQRFALRQVQMCHGILWQPQIYVNTIFKNHETQLKNFKSFWIHFKFNPSPFAKLPICAKSPDRHPGEKTKHPEGNQWMKWCLVLQSAIDPRVQKIHPTKTRQSRKHKKISCLVPLTRQRMSRPLKQNASSTRGFASC